MIMHVMNLKMASEMHIDMLYPFCILETCFEQVLFIFALKNDESFHQAIEIRLRWRNEG